VKKLAILFEIMFFTCCLSLTQIGIFVLTIGKDTPLENWLMVESFLGASVFYWLTNLYLEKK